MFCAILVRGISCDTYLEATNKRVLDFPLVFLI